MKSKFKIPGTFTIVFLIIVLAAIATWFVPSGEFIRETQIVDGSAKEVLVPNSYHHVDAQPQTWQVFSAFFNGFVKTSHIIVFIFMIGGAFWIFNSTHSIDVGVKSFLTKMENLQQKSKLKHLNINLIVISCIMIMFSLFGAVFGMSEETIAFVIIFIPLSISMGYDSIVGMAMCYLAAHVGFAGAIFNPFTIGIAQGLADLPAFSGFEYRMLCWLIFTILGIAFVLFYASKVKKNPQISPMYQLDEIWRNKTAIDTSFETRNTTASAWILWGILSVIFIFLSVYQPQTTIAVSTKSFVCPLIPVFTVLFILTGCWSLRKNIHAFILNLLFYTIIALIVGVLGYQWYVMEIATLFFIMGICAGIAYNYPLDNIFKLFLEGCKDIMSAALIVGLAGGIIVVLQEGRIIDTMLYSMANTLSGAGKETSLGVMYTFQNLLNLIIPSGSAKAALTIPIMSEFSDMLSISRQTMVLAFQFGDGITNMITPASGVLLGCLGVAKIPYSIWVKWIYKFIIFLFILGFILLLPTIYFSFNGF